MRPANSKARALIEKLQRLADPANGGTAGEIDVANRKLARLKALFDFSTPRSEETLDIFAGIKAKRTARRASHVFMFHGHDFDIANAVKWAIEKATGIPCIFRGGELLAETAATTARKLSGVALHIAQSFQSLLDKFGCLEGVTAADRRLFVRGLYDGMMNDGRASGEPLPSAPGPKTSAKKSRKGDVTRRPGLSIHPYTVALALGKHVRFAVPLSEIAAELERATRAPLGAGETKAA